MGYYWYNGHKIEYLRYNNLKSKDLVERLKYRLYGICFKDEEYVERGFKLSNKGIVVKLEDDFNMEVAWDIVMDKESKVILMKKNPKLCRNLVWYSLFNGNREMRNRVLECIDSILS